MKLYKKEAASSDPLAERIAGKIISRQRRLATYLNHKTLRFKAKQVGYILLICCLCFGAYYTYLIIESITNFSH